MNKIIMYSLLLLLFLNFDFSKIDYYCKIEIFTIGNQIWQNNYIEKKIFHNGDTIFQAKSKEDWINASQKCIPAWCYFNFSNIDSLKSGKFYNWYVVSDSRGIIDSGWRIPNIFDFEILTKYCENNIENVNPNFRNGNFFDFNGVSADGEFDEFEKKQWIFMWGINEYKSGFSNEINACAYLYDSIQLTRTGTYGYFPKGCGFKIRLIKNN